MKINEIRPTEGSRVKAYRKGRGHGSGNGKTSGRGHKGQKARSGGGVRLQFEGGQMPLYRRLPKRGFNNKRFAKDYIEVNVGELNCFSDGDTVDASAIRAKGIVAIPKVFYGIKILGNGDISAKLNVKAKAFTTSAKEKIIEAGGTVEEI